MKMKSYIILLITILFVSAKAQEKITIVPKWEDNETKTLISLSNNYYDEIADTGANSFSDTSKIYHLKVIKKENSYNLIWKEERTKYISETEKIFADKLSLNIALNKKGEFQKLNNKTEVYNLFNDFIKDMLSSLKKDKSKKDEYKKAKKDFDEINKMITADTLEFLIKKETSFFFGIYGKTIIINDTVYYTKEKSGTTRNISATAKRINDEQILIIETYRTNKNKAPTIEEEIIEAVEEAINDYEDNEYSTEYIYNTKTGWVESILDNNIFFTTKYILK